MVSAGIISGVVTGRYGEGQMMSAAETLMLRRVWTGRQISDGRESAMRLEIESESWRLRWTVLLARASRMSDAPHLLLH
jgi:hypothetical protein